MQHKYSVFLILSKLMRNAFMINRQFEEIAMHCFISRMQYQSESTLLYLP